MLFVLGKKIFIKIKWQLNFPNISMMKCLINTKTYAKLSSLPRPESRTPLASAKPTS